MKHEKADNPILAKNEAIGCNAIQLITATRPRYSNRTRHKR